jgi:uncharacterized protein YcfL
MKKIITLSIIALALAGCECNESTTDVKHVVPDTDHKSISGTIKFTLSSDVNHIGKSTLTNVLIEELLEAESNINQKLKDKGLPQGQLNFIKKD